uniref:Ubiquitin carboxyl-terminal hydrolase n=1 Tax=Euplotes harpa TaxID=151035 RepID=A0A7S3JMI0_9SPIT
MVSLGMSDEWQIGEIFGLDDDCLSFVPQPCLGVIVTFEQSAVDDAKPGSGDDSEVVQFYMKQTGTLDNACGIIASLHAILNHQSQITFQEGSILDRFAKATNALSPADRAKYLEDFKEFKEMHQEEANKGQTDVPSGTDDVKHHFVAFIRNSSNQLVELDGLKDGPAIIEDNCEDLLKGVAKELQRRLEINSISESMSMMALAKKP